MHKIVFITPSFKTGGGNRVFIELANQLCQSCEIRIVYPANSSEAHTFSVDPRVKLEQVGNLSVTKIGKLWNVWKCIRCLNRKYKEDIQVISDPFFSIFCFLLRSRRVYRFMQGDDYRIFDDGQVIGKGRLLALYKRLCLRSYQTRIKYIFNSRFVYEQYCKDAAQQDVPFLLVHPALNHRIFHEGEQRLEPSTLLNVCLVARKHPSKGLVTFLHMYRKLPESILKRIGQVILISHDDLSGMDIEGMIRIKPSSDEEIARVYQTSDIFISTSWREGFGLPPLEAMACGCAVITSDSKGIREYAREEENCLIFEPKDESQLEERLIRLIKDQALREKLAASGLHTAKRFSWEKSAGAFLTIIGEN